MKIHRTKDNLSDFVFSDFEGDLMVELGRMGEYDYCYFPKTFPLPTHEEGILEEIELDHLLLDELIDNTDKKDINPVYNFLKNLSL